MTDDDEMEATIRFRVAEEIAVASSPNSYLPLDGVAFLLRRLDEVRTRLDTRQAELLQANNAEVERRRAAETENGWLRRLLRWCRPRLKHASYQTWLDKYLALGPSPAPKDEPEVLCSDILARVEVPGNPGVAGYAHFSGVRAGCPIHPFDTWTRDDASMFCNRADCSWERAKPSLAALHDDAFAPHPHPSGDRATAYQGKRVVEPPPSSR